MARLLPTLVAGALAGLVFFGPQAARAEDSETEERRARLKKAQTEFEAEEADFVRRVNAAIERGTKWLVSKQRADGHWKTYKPNTLDRIYPGRAGLIMLTLAKCGLEIKGRDKVLQRGITALEGYRAWFDSKATTAEQRGGHTYSKAILVLMYDALYARHPKPKPGRKRRAPAKAKRKRKNPCKLPKKVDAEIRKLIRWIEENQAEKIWRYPGPADADQDLSNTQYALLALQAAGRCGLETSPAVYRRALSYLLAHQAKNGPSVQLYVANPAWQPGVDRYGPVMPARKARARGWSYLPGTRSTGSMTTAGIACLAIIKERLRDLGVLTVEERKAIDAALRDGVGWFTPNFTVDRNPGNPSWHYYYLYGLERAGDLLGLRYMGTHDWYREGAEHLIGAQFEGGSWAGAGKDDPNGHGQTELVRTCFALLFLKRATVPPTVPVGPAITGG